MRTTIDDKSENSLNFLNKGDLFGFSKSDFEKMKSPVGL